jgi:hypothetical protein
MSPKGKESKRDKNKMESAIKLSDCLFNDAHLYNSIMNNTISFKIFQTIIIHYYLLKHVF